MTTFVRLFFIHKQFNDIHQALTSSAYSRDRDSCPIIYHLRFYFKKQVHYLFGGNPGKESLPKIRLDDFWALKVRAVLVKIVVES